MLWRSARKDKAPVAASCLRLSRNLNLKYKVANDRILLQAMANPADVRIGDDSIDTPGLF